MASEREVIWGQRLEEPADAPRASAPDSDVGAKAGALAVSRELKVDAPTLEELIGQPLAEKLKAKLDSAELASLGSAAVSRVLDRARVAVRRVSATTSAELRDTITKAGTDLINNAGHAFDRDTLQRMIHALGGSPTGVAGKVLIALAVGQLSHLTIQAFEESLSLGETTNLALTAELGTVRHGLVESLKAELRGSMGDFTAMASVGLIGGRTAHDALDGRGAEALPNRMLEQVRADITYQLGRYGSASLDNETLLSQGQVVAGTVSAKSDLAASGARLGLEAKRDYGDRGRTTLSAEVGLAGNPVLDATLRGKRSTGDQDSREVVAGLDAHVTPQLDIGLEARRGNLDGVASSAVSAKAAWHASESTHIDATVSRSRTGADRSSAVSLSAAHKWGTDRDVSLGVEYNGADRAHDKVTFSMNLGRTFGVQGHYDQATGHYVGVVFRLPLP